MTDATMTLTTLIEKNLSEQQLRSVGEAAMIGPHRLVRLEC